MTRFGTFNSPSDVLILILGPPICIIVGCVILSASRDPFFPMVEIALGYGLIVVGVAVPISTLLSMRYSESVVDEAPELEFHNDGRISLVINDAGTDGDE